MAASTNALALGPEVARLPCRSRCAYGRDMGHWLIGYLFGPLISSLVLVFVIFVAQEEGDVLRKLGLLRYFSVAEVYVFAYVTGAIFQYWFWFSAPNRPIVIHQKGIRYKHHVIPFSEIYGVRVGSGELVSPEFRFTRLGRAMARFEARNQTTANLSFCVMTRTYRQVTVNLGLVMYERAGLAKLFKLIGEKRPEPVGLEAACA